jgi:hypothetical protein
MKGQSLLGLFGAVAIVATTLGISLQSGIGRGPADANSEPKPGPSATGAKLQDSDSCDSITSAIGTFLNLAADRIPRLKACKPGSSLPSGIQANLKFVIATVPDPVHTHLQLTFDRMTEAIQQAAQDENYPYDTSWLPWEDQSPTYASLSDQDKYSTRKSAREKQPGLLLFRNDAPPEHGGSEESLPSQLRPYFGGLVVFLVEEDPTNGIQSTQFNNALEWVSELKHLNKDSIAPFSILGPAFSGSFDSFAKLLANSLSGELDLTIQGNRLAIYSGTANSGGAIDGFTKTLTDLTAKNTKKLTINFYNFLERDEVGLERYCEFFKRQGGKASAIAILSEGETVYGRFTDERVGEGSPCADALHLSYPRDMSSLRSAYQTNSIFNQPASQQSAEAPRTHLPSDLADPEGQGHDTIRSYSGNQKPLSQEAFLLSVVNSLRANRIESVLLRSTNAFDQIFLARYLRREYPNARIVFDGVDRLFERERDSSEMVGTLSLSSYPLLELQHQLQQQLQHQHFSKGETTFGIRQFNADYLEGTYIAFRFLLFTAFSQHANDPDCQFLTRQEGYPNSAIRGTLPVLEKKCPYVNMTDYAPPSWVLTGADDSISSSRRPATWLSVLNKSGYWPIAAINEDTLMSGSKVNSLLPKDTVPIPLEFVIFLLCLLAFSSFHLWCCRNASFTAKPAFLAHFANPLVRDHTILIACGSAFLALLPLFAGLGFGLFDWNGSILPYRWLVGTAVFLACAMALAAGFVNVARIQKLTRASVSGSKPRKDFKPVIAGSLSCLMLFGAIGWYSTTVDLIPANRYFTYFRSVHIFSRISPMVPIVVLLLGLYAWFWQSLHGLALFGSDRVKLPKRAHLELPDPDDPGKPMKILPMFSNEHAEETEEYAKPLHPKVVRTSIILFVALSGITLTLSRGTPIRTLGTQFFSYVFLLTLIACICLMLVNALRLLKTWMKLRELLKYLDLLPLRRTLAALRGFSWGSVWGMSGNVLDVRYKLLSRQLECLGHTQVAMQEKLDMFRLPDQALPCIADLDRTNISGREFAKRYTNNYSDPDAEEFNELEAFQESAADAASSLLLNVLIPSWREETKSLILDTAPESGRTDDDRHKSLPISETEYVRNAEEFVCLPYLGFVQNVLGRMRTIVMSILWLFVAATIAISSYPFDPRQGLAGAMIALFLILSAVVLYVYVQMHKDTTLSRITNTVPGELGADFWFKLVGVGLVPLLGLLATVFPGISDFVFSWLRPGLQSIR